MEKLCESVLENHVDKDTKISKVSSECAEKIHAVYDLFITQWAASKDVKVPCYIFLYLRIFLFYT